MNQMTASALREYEQQISQASKCQTVEDALALLSSKLEQDVLAYPHLLARPESRSAQLLLAGILSKAGHFEESGKALGQFKTIKGSSPVDAVIVDPGLVHLDGHHYNSNYYFKELIEHAGLSSRVFRNMRDDPSFDHDEISSVPTFSLSPYERLFSEPYDSKELSAYNDFFAMEFGKVLPRARPRLTVVHSARHTFVEGICKYLGSCIYDGSSSLLLGVIETDAINKTHPSYEVVREVYTKAFSVLKRVSGLKILAFVETEELAEFLADTSERWLEPLVVPYVGGYLRELRSDRKATNNLQPVIGYVGQTRPERGALLIPEIAVRTLKSLGNDCRWKAQLDIPRMRRHMGENLDELLARPEMVHQFEIVGTALSLSNYLSLLESVDIMVMPYSERYNTTGSGIAAECLKMGCVLVVPESSSMARQARFHGAGLVTFDNLSVASVADAIELAVDKFPELQRASLSAASNQDLGAMERLAQFVQDA